MSKCRAGVSQSETKRAKLEKERRLTQAYSEFLPSIVKSMASIMNSLQCPEHEKVKICDKLISRFGQTLQVKNQDPRILRAASALISSDIPMDTFPGIDHTKGGEAIAAHFSSDIAEMFPNT